MYVAFVSCFSSSILLSNYDVEAKINSLKTLILTQDSLLLQFQIMTKNKLQKTEFIDIPDLI